MIHKIKYLYIYCLASLVINSKYKNSILIELAINSDIWIMHVLLHLLFYRLFVGHVFWTLHCRLDTYVHSWKVQWIISSTVWYGIWGRCLTEQVWKGVNFGWFAVSQDVGQGLWSGHSSIKCSLAIISIFLLAVFCILLLLPETCPVVSKSYLIHKICDKYILPSSKISWWALIICRW